MENIRLLVPIQNLIIERIVKLGEVIFLPCYFLHEDNYIMDSSVSQKERDIIDDFINKNEEFIKECADNGIVLACLDRSNVHREWVEEILLEQSCELVNRALDFIRINYCRFDSKETLPSIPGVLGRNRVGFIVDDEKDSITVIRGGSYNFYLQPGIGLEADLWSPQEDGLYDIIFSNRNDEVYLEHRAILARACDAMHITDLNRCFSYLFSSVERMGSREYEKFGVRKKKIISWIARNEEEYRELNTQFLFFSKDVRTEIVHKGKDILEIVSKERANQIINSLFLVILRFCEKTIMSEITRYSQLEVEIEKKRGYFEQANGHISNQENSEQQEYSTEIINNDYLEKNVLAIIPITNLELDNIIKFGEAIIVPKNTEECLYNYFDQDSLMNNNILNDLLRNSEIRKLNKEASLCIFTDKYYLEEEWYPDKEMNFLELLCKKADKILNYIVLKYCSIYNQDRMPTISGIYEGYRRGMLFNLDTKECRNLLGKVYHMYGETKKVLILDNLFPNDIDMDLYQCLYSSRTDEVFNNCRNALSRICEALYLNNYTISLTYMFDTLDMLDPLHINQDKLRGTILPFIAGNRSEYHSIGEEMKQLSQNFRTPMLHHGKSIYEIIERSEEIYEIFGKLMKWIGKYCEVVVSTNIENFSDLQEARKEKMTQIGV